MFPSKASTSLPLFIRTLLIANTITSSFLFHPINNFIAKRNDYQSFLVYAESSSYSSSTTTSTVNPHRPIFNSSQDNYNDNTTTSQPKQQKIFNVIQAQIIHRHGDRTPITSMKDVQYWKQTLPSDEILDKISQGTIVTRGITTDIPFSNFVAPSQDSKTSTFSTVITTTDDDDGDKSKPQQQQQQHSASGIGPFGKLTQLGLLQMVDVGSQIRNELHLDNDHNIDNNNHSQEQQNYYFHNHGKLFTPLDPIHPSKIKIYSTDFPRTIQSVQALLIGLLPDFNTNNNYIQPTSSSTATTSSSLLPIEIDARYTNHFIPDPQPRWTQEQFDLETTLSQRQHIIDRERELRDLAIKTTLALQEHLCHTVISNSKRYGIGEEVQHHDNDTTTTTSSSSTIVRQIKPLSWSQLSEITTCLRVRNMLPPSITQQDYETIHHHAAWRWFENLKHERLIHLSMKRFMDILMYTIHHGTLVQKRLSSGTSSSDSGDYNKLYIYSCHDSSLMGLLCAFRLEQPVKWPEYGSYLKIELIESTISSPSSSSSGSDVVHDNGATKDDGKEYFVRFSMNGTILKSLWGVGEDNYKEPLDMIPLDHLTNVFIREYGNDALDELNR